MEPNTQTGALDLDSRLAERFKELPKVVQDAITSADVQKHMRELADSHKLHLDQWQILENEVMLALLGFQPVEDLQKNIKKEVGISDERSTILAADISKVVFEPIRAELERSLEHPDAQAAEVSAVDAAVAQALGDEAAKALPETPSTPPVAPGTPPAPPPSTQAVRAPISEAYKAGEASTARKDVVDDPYREPPK